MNKKKFIKNLPLILFDIICVIMAIFVATIIANEQETGSTNYIYYIPYYIVGLTFLQMAVYFVLGVYELDVDNFDLSDLNMIWISNGIVLVCNIVTILITGWFTVLWAIFYSLIFVALSCGLRFMFRVSAIKKQERQESKFEKENTLDNNVENNDK